jgi:hypothetical protein
MVAYADRRHRFFLTVLLDYFCFFCLPQKKKIPERKEEKKKGIPLLLSINTTSKKNTHERNPKVLSRSIR